MEMRPLALFRVVCKIRKKSTKEVVMSSTDKPGNSFRIDSPFRTVRALMFSV